MSRRPTRPVHVIGMIENNQSEILITLPKSDTSKRCWGFPCGIAADGESPEAAMRRIATEQLDLTIEIVVGQPPLQETIDGKEVELRYFFCGVITGEQSTGVYEEVRWISKSHLREYDFSAELAPVIEWLLER